MYAHAVNNKEEKSIEKFSRLACSYDEPEGCIEHAINREIANQLGEARKELQPLCETKDVNARGCFEFGSLLLKIGEEKLAVKAFKSSCDEGFGKGMRRAAQHINSKKTNQHYRFKKITVRN